MSAAATAGGPERLPPSAPPRQNRRFPGEEIQVEHAAQCIEAAIEERFGSRIPVGRELAGLDELQRIVEHRSHRRYSERTVEPPLLRLLLACALSAPSKSDLQQADIVHVADREKVRAMSDLVPDSPWIAEAPVLLVFCANNRRIRQIGEWRGKPFANEHLDHFMNAAVDAAIVMTTFIRAAEAVGLGTCPISMIRNKPREVSELLRLPEGVFPVAGLTAGYPREEGRITPRLPLEVTVHTDQHDESRVREHIEAYDRRRHELMPYRKQRSFRRFGEAPFYGWSEDKARQYGVPERTDWGAFVRSKGFSLK
jgi:FMN reductase [NAD(P)H]